MANELNVNVSLTFQKNGAEIQRSLSASLNVTGNQALQGIQTITTADSTLDLGSVATPGFLLIHNLDLTNFVTFGSNGTVYPGKLKAIEFGLMRWNGAAIHFKADTASCDLEYILIPD